MNKLSSIGVSQKNMGEGLLPETEMTQIKLHHQKPPASPWVTTHEFWKPRPQCIACRHFNRLESVLSRCDSLSGSSACLRAFPSRLYCLYMPGEEHPSEFGQFQGLRKVFEYFLIVPASYSVLPPFRPACVLPPF